MSLLVALALGCILSSKPKNHEYDKEDFCYIYGIDESILFGWKPDSSAETVKEEN